MYGIPGGEIGDPGGEVTSLTTLLSGWSSMYGIPGRAGNSLI